jgi:hypothetical protein
MTLAAVGWGVWWTGLVLARFAPWIAPEFWSGRTLITVLSVACAVPGLVLGLSTMRAKRSWLPFAMVAVFANASLLVTPWLLQGIEAVPG